MTTSCDIIIKPIITEKSMACAAEKKYVFKVADNANKIMIKKAVEELFKVEVKSVNTISMKSKTVRRGFARRNLMRTVPGRARRRLTLANTRSRRSLW